MSGKRILFISPVGTHPQYEGNCERFFQIVDALRSLGVTEMYLCLVHIPPFSPRLDSTAMESYWDGNYTRIETSWKASPGIMALPVRTLWASRLCRQMTRFLSKNWHDRLADVLHGGDSWFPPGLGPWLRRFASDWRPDVVVCEYLFLSKAFAYLSPNVRRVVDTHDVFVNRNIRLRQKGVDMKWLSLSARQERRMCRRADKILAIQQLEANYFRTLVEPSHVHLVDILSMPAVTVPQLLSSESIGYLGSANPINQEGLRWFVTEVFPQLQKRHPGVRLRVGGRVGEAITPANGIDVLGEISDRAAFYGSCRFFINPHFGGTGLKIKSVEALAYAKPLVTTADGAAGLEPAAGGCIEIARDSNEFFTACHALLSQPGESAQKGAQAVEFINTRRNASLRELAAAVLN